MVTVGVDKSNIINSLARTLEGAVPSRVLVAHTSRFYSTELKYFIITNSKAILFAVILGVLLSPESAELNWGLLPPSALFLPVYLFI